MKPTDTQTVDQIKAYLDAHNISYTTTMTKPELLGLVNGGGN
nr:MAG TPA: LAMINA-ASSOCIATED POLYPEPTIDE 2 PROTEIN, INNER NUCLEAR MEMBRANE [Caudoviricetes sp.]